MSLKVGKIETGVSQSEPTRKKLKIESGSISGGNGGGKNPGGGGGGSGDDGGNNQPRKLDFSEPQESFKPDKLKIVMWFLLLVVLMTFGGLISAYIVISTNGAAEWKPFNLPFQVWISTFLILLSSGLYQVANGKVQREEQDSGRKWLLATVVVGATFISSQLLAWFALVQRGIYVQSNPYAGFFYILTVVHAVHVLGGMIALGYLVLRTWLPTQHAEELLRRKTASRVIGWYWHFMDALWLALVALLGFWK